MLMTVREKWWKFSGDYDKIISYFTISSIPIDQSICSKRAEFEKVSLYSSSIQIQRRAMNYSTKGWARRGRLGCNFYWSVSLIQMVAIHFVNSYWSQLAISLTCSTSCHLSPDNSSLLTDLLFILKSRIPSTDWKCTAASVRAAPHQARSAGDGVLWWRWWESCFLLADKEVSSNQVDHPPPEWL